MNADPATRFDDDHDYDEPPGYYFESYEEMREHVLEEEFGPAFVWPERLRELRAMPYPDFLRTDEWRDTRLRRIAWAGHRCELCDDGEGPFHVHHRNYDRIGCEKLTDLIVLCHRCHHRHHRLLKLAGQHPSLN